MKRLLLMLSLGLIFSACDEYENKSTSEGDIVWIGNGMVQSHGVIADFVSESGSVYSKVLTEESSFAVVETEADKKEVPVYLRWSQAKKPEKSEGKAEAILEVQPLSSNPLARSLSAVGKTFEQNEEGRLHRRRDLEALDLKVGTTPKPLSDGRIIYLNSEDKLVEKADGQEKVLLEEVAEFRVDANEVVASLNETSHQWTFFQAKDWKYLYTVATPWVFLGEDQRFYFFILEPMQDLEARSIYAVDFVKGEPQFEFVGRAPEAWTIEAVEEPSKHTASQSLQISDQEGASQIVSLSHHGFEILNDEESAEEPSTLHVSSDGDFFLTKAPTETRRSLVQLCRLSGWQVQSVGVEDLDCEELKLPEEFYVHDAVLGPNQRVYVVAKLELVPIEGEVELEFNPQLLVFELSEKEGEGFRLVSQRELEADVHSLRWLNAVQDETLQLKPKIDSPQIDLPQ